MEKHFHLKANLIDVKGDWGMEVNGTWTGAIGQVLNGVIWLQSKSINFINFAIQQSDIAMCGLTRTYNRLKILDFTQFIFLSKMSFMLQNTDYWYNDWIFARSFSHATWISLLSTYLLSAFVLNVHLYKMSYPKTLFKLFAILMNQCKLNKTNCLFVFNIFFSYISPNIAIKLYKSDQIYIVRFILTLLIVGNFFLKSYYNCNFSSLLAFRTKYYPIKGTMDLVNAANSDSYNILVYSSSSYHTLFKNANSDSILYYAIGQHLNR